MAKFRKRPVVIEAEQFFSNKKPYPEGVVETCMSSAIPSPAVYYVETLEGPLNVSEGDWIITGVQNEKYPCKPDIFEKTYEPV